MMNAIMTQATIVFPLQAPAKYAWEWAVKDDYTYNDYAAQETRDGDNTQVWIDHQKGCSHG